MLGAAIVITEVAVIRALSGSGAGKDKTLKTEPRNSELNVGVLRAVLVQHQVTEPMQL